MIINLSQRFQHRREQGGNPRRADARSEDRRGPAGAWRKVNLLKLMTGYGYIAMSEKEKDIPVDEKPGMIKNPLKIPPVNKKSELDYDIEVPDDDDYDIK